MLLLADRVFGSPVPSFIYFEFYDSPVTIKVEAYFSDFQIGKIYFYFLLVIDKSGWAVSRSETSYSGLGLGMVRTPTRRNGPGAWLWLTAMIGLFVTSNWTELMPQSSFIPHLRWAGMGWLVSALFGKYHLRDTWAPAPAATQLHWQGMSHVSKQRHHPSPPHHLHLHPALSSTRASLHCWSMTSYEHGVKSMMSAMTVLRYAGAL